MQIFSEEATYNERSLNFKPREKWKLFRELISDKWTQAFIDKIFDETGQRDLIYYIAVTKLTGKIKDYENIETPEIIKNRFQKYNSNILLKVINLENILLAYFDRVKNKKTPTLESSTVGRLLQLIHAANLTIK